jgi:hypothetical protein
VQIGGRQFDVAVRKKLNQQEHLTLLECRDRRRPIDVDTVDAFVTKASDAGADRKVVVATSSFRRGCLAVARRHGIELLQVLRVNEIPENLRPRAAPSVDPSLVAHGFVVREILTSKQVFLSAWDVSEGFQTVVVVGGFYYSPAIGANYACVGISQKGCQLVALDLEQQGLQLVVELTVNQNAASQRYLRVEDQREIQRLSALLAQYKAARARGLSGRRHR